MTVEYCQGNAFNGDGCAVVVTVNCVGAMGRGIALECKHRMHYVYKAYKQACNRRKIVPGEITFPWCLFEGDRIKKDSGHQCVVLLPTKLDWKKPSKLEWVQSGIGDLALIATKRNWSVVDMTLPGCDNGWIKDKGQVKSFIESSLGPLETHFRIWSL